MSDVTLQHEVGFYWKLCQILEFAVSMKDRNLERDTLDDMALLYVNSQHAGLRLRLHRLALRQNVSAGFMCAIGAQRALEA